MITLAMVFAALVGVIQLMILGSATRSVRLGIVLLSVGVGMYGCGVAAVALEYVYTRLVARMSGGLFVVQIYDVVKVASYTIAPFIEELVKIAPLVFVAQFARTRFQWGLTDYVLLGSGLGAGFGLFEAIMRYGSRIDRITSFPGGWVFPTSLYPPFIPEFGLSVSSWLPAPVSKIDLDVKMLVAGIGPEISQHLVWSALAGLGMGMMFKFSRWRFLGLVPLLLVSVDHAAWNYKASVLSENLVMEIISWPFIMAKPLFWLWPLLAIVIAFWVDYQVLSRQRRHQQNLLLAGEHHNGLISTIAYGLMRPPWTTLITLRFLLLRRAALYAADIGAGDQAEPLLAEVIAIRTQMDITREPQAWRGIGIRRVVSEVLSAIRKNGSTGRIAWLLLPWLVWLVLVIPSLLYYGVGGTPSGAGMQETLTNGWAFRIVLGVFAVSLAWIGWQIISGIWALPAARQQPDGSVAAGVQFRLFTATGAGFLGVITLLALLNGGSADQPLLSSPLLNSFFGLDAINLLLIAGIIILVLAVILVFPPSAAGFATTLGVGLGGLATVPVGNFLLAAAALAAYGIVIRSAEIRSGTMDPADFPPLPQLPSPWRPPVGPILAATVAAIAGVYNARDHLLDPKPPEVDIIPAHQYQDINGDIRWMDTNQLVKDFPIRPQILGDDGVLRWADTGNPVFQADTTKISADGAENADDGVENYVQQSPIEFDHVIKADYTSEGKPSGGHSLVHGDVRIVPGTESAPDVAGVYKATIQVPDPENTGQWITKTSNNSTNTMFPKSWDEAKIKMEVDAAWNDPNKIIQGDKWMSVTPSGVKVEGWISPRATVYPVYQDPLNP